MKLIWGKSMWESWFLPSTSTSTSTSTSISDNESCKRADNIFTLNPRYFSSITIYMWPLYNATKNPNLILQGVEFRPL
ncbi:hypothetical protein M8C21_000361 [Ambrosia artemisiifolia]|uniref:Uncharacterized protein n=1 Tax=Ambrosia artemisiifolia TaxID=4212 RepID=A0AAD5CUH9_AMBAR|nr:hypothetical protein M8C21_000361 [Ambrosia artemisiifolia]